MSLCAIAYSLSAREYGSMAGGGVTELASSYMGVNVCTAVLGNESLPIGFTHLKTAGRFGDFPNTFTFR